MRSSKCGRVQCLLGTSQDVHKPRSRSYCSHHNGVTQSHRKHSLESVLGIVCTVRQSQGTVQGAGGHVTVAHVCSTSLPGMDQHDYDYNLTSALDADLHGQLYAAPGPGASLSRERLFVNKGAGCCATCFAT